MPRVRRALISVSDKKDVVWFAKELASLGVEIISTGGTYKLLTQEGVKAIPVVEVTEFPEMLDGRVKTLHPKIHGGILADRGNPEHVRQLEYQKIKPIDMVVVNLYPFEKTVSSPGVSRQEAIEQIDIGGPAMVRAAAKNHDHVVVVVNPERYGEIIREMKESGGEVSADTARSLAVEAFRHTASYDARISEYLAGIYPAHPAPGEGAPAAQAGEEKFPGSITLGFERVEVLRYGENPHQGAALYAEVPRVPDSLACARKVHGPALSFNNLLDADSAWACALEFAEPACVIVKHNNPCGVAVHEDIALAYQKAYDCDPVSAYGSVIAFNRVLTPACAERLKGLFVEVLVAPGYEPEALELLGQKHDLRIIELKPRKEWGAGWDYKRIDGGILLQERDADPCDRAAMKVVTGRPPTEEEWRDLLFAWRVCKHVKSNAIVLAKGGATVGIGAGQMSRVDSARIAVEKAGSDRAPGSVAASDAFFPFPDALKVLAEAGATAAIQPGGSVRDEEVIELCARYGMAMVFTGIRHFRH